MDVVCGLPYGSILLSLSLIAYINDIYNVSLYLNFELYADGTMFYIIHNNNYNNDNNGYF